MPIYEYRCKTCGELNEFLVLKKDEALTCKKCSGQDLVKLMSAPNISAANSQASQAYSESSSDGCCGTPGSCGSPGSCCSG